MTMKRAVAAGLMAIALGLGAGAAWAASGTALGVDPQAEADKDGTARVLTVGADIFIGDTIKTGPQGNVQIKFSDSTELVVGPNSQLLLEDYLLRDDQSAGKFAINALSGTFRFATGTSPKDSYVINTPTGTIGVRGTWFDFNVDQVTRVVVYRGRVIMCDKANECVSLNDSCEMGEIDDQEAAVIGKTTEVSDEQRQSFQDEFIYGQNQTPLHREFWFERTRECFNKEFEPNFPNRDNVSKPADEPEDDCTVGSLAEVPMPLAGYAFPVTDVAAAAPPCPN
jgi:hypothetical protein